MANWCENGLTVSGTEAELGALLADAAGEGSAFSLARLHPAPDGVDGTDLEAWHEEHWGTKWDLAEVAVERRGPGEAFVQFDSAANPPLPAVLHLSQRYPGLRFAIAYEEPNEGLQGTGEVQAGAVLSHDEHELAEDDDDDEAWEDDEDES